MWDDMVCYCRYLVYGVGRNYIEVADNSVDDTLGAYWGLLVNSIRWHLIQTVSIDGKSGIVASSIKAKSLQQPKDAPTSCRQAPKQLKTPLLGTATRQITNEPKKWACREKGPCDAQRKLVVIERVG